MFYLNYLKEVPSEAFMFIKYRKTQQRDKCFTNTFGPKLLWMARNCHLGGVSARMAGTVRGEGTYAAGPQNGIASLAVSCSVCLNEYCSLYYMREL